VISTGQPTVPNVVDKTLSEAEKAITDAGLVVGKITLALDDSVPAGSVISQNPGPGAAPCGSAVDLVVSDGPCVVPDVVGMTEARARAAIEAVDDFLVGDVTPECSDTVLAGNVIRQEPVAGPAPCGSSVDLVVSTGQPSVPDVVGMAEGDAIAAIEAVADLLVGAVTPECSDTVPAGDVIRQEPVPGPAPCGSSVDLVISTGQPDVPDVVGMTRGEAEKAITDAGLLLGDVTLAFDDSVPAGSVISQDPGPGTVLCGSVVDLVVSDGPCVVPDVVGMTEAQAKNAIEAVDDFSVGDVTPECSDTVSAGNITVYRQVLSAASIRPQEKPCHVTLLSALRYQQAGLKCRTLSG
jgi:beta-lactam-binding protein with PASTA domain